MAAIVGLFIEVKFAQLFRVTRLGLVVHQRSPPTHRFRLARLFILEYVRCINAQIVHVVAVRLNDLRITRGSHTFTSLCCRSPFSIQEHLP